MSIFKDKIWQEILDGKKSWTVSEKTSQACDLFEVQVVSPLRTLRDEGRIRIDEIKAPMPSSYRVYHVRLLGILRLDDE
jgi:hypothetical protein